VLNAYLQTKADPKPRGLEDLCKMLVILPSPILHSSLTNRFISVEELSRELNNFIAIRLNFDNTVYCCSFCRKSNRVPCPKMVNAIRTLNGE
jgi:hypothetical protein